MIELGRETNHRISKILSFVGLVFCIFHTNTVFAWGQLGHSVIANIAEDRLTPDTTRKVHGLLQVEGYSHLNEIANWADKYRIQKKKDQAASIYPEPSHMARFPNNFSTPSTELVCKKFCAIQGVLLYYEILKDTQRSPADRLLALKWLVHLVGDLHQPFHGSTFPAGGIKVSFQGKLRSLHDFWDVDIITELNQSSSTLKAHVLARNCVAPLSTNPRIWALEGRDLVRDKILPSTPYQELINQLPSNYKDHNLSIAECRLKAAGLRLAEIINEAL